MLNFVRGEDRGETAVLKNMVYKLSKQLSKEQATRIGLGKSRRKITRQKELIRDIQKIFCFII